jgi:nucleoside-diphosphate-sugar epimerase
MNILVTGGDSFIARSIKASPLFKEHVLFAPSHTGLDVTKPILSFVKEHAIEYIIHTAVDTKESRQAYDNNMLMFANVLRCAPEVKGIICFGSGVEVCEDYSIENAKGYYRAAKQMQSRHINTAGYDNVFSIRLYGVFGPLEDKHRFPSYVIRQALMEEDIHIEQDRMFTYSYIEDVLECVTKIMELNTNAFDTPRYFVRSLLYFAYLIKKACSSSSRVFVEAIGDGAKYAPDYRQIYEPPAGENGEAFVRHIREQMQYMIDNGLVSDA